MEIVVLVTAQEYNYLDLAWMQILANTQIFISLIFRIRIFCIKISVTCEISSWAVTSSGRETYSLR